MQNAAETPEVQPLTILTIYGRAYDVELTGDEYGTGRFRPRAILTGTRGAKYVAMPFVNDQTRFYLVSYARSMRVDPLGPVELAFAADGETLEVVRS